MRCCNRSFKNISSIVFISLSLATTIVYSKNCCGSCCGSYDDGNLFVIDFVENKYSRFFSEIKIEKCPICCLERDKLPLWVRFVCSASDEHLMCCGCFFNGVNHVLKDGVNGDRLFYKCPFGKKQVVFTHANLKYLFLESDIFDSSKELNKTISEIETLVRQRENKIPAKEDFDVSLKDLKKHFRELNSRDNSIVTVKPCPFCNLPIERDPTHCNAMTCQRCYCFFCWLCGWFTFGSKISGEEHFFFRDCIEKGGLCIWQTPEKATYYSYGYLWGNDEYKKPRFFKHELNSDSDFYLLYKDNITSYKYDIEESIRRYNNGYNPNELQRVPGTEDHFTYYRNKLS